MRKNKPSIVSVFLSIFYITACCFIFLLTADVLIDLVFSGQVNINMNAFKKMAFTSLIAGIAVSIGGVIFNHIDNRNS